MTDERLVTIYMLRFPNEKNYVGQTKNIEKRLSEHQHRNNCTLVHNAIKKYGWENICVIIVGQVPADAADEEEEYLIELFRSLAPNGYNLSPGGQSRRAYNLPETADKFRATMLNKRKDNPTYGKMSKETHELAMQKAKETRKKRKAAGKDYRPSQEAIESARQKKIGRTVSPEALAKRERVKAEKRALDPTYGIVSEEKKAAAIAKFKETIAKKKAENPNYGKMSPEAKARVIANKTGKPRSKESVDKRVETMRQKLAQDPNYGQGKLRGRKRDPEIIAKWLATKAAKSSCPALRFCLSLPSVPSPIEVCPLLRYMKEAI